MIFLGRLRMWGLPFFQPVGIQGERHIGMIAGSGSGKTTNLITWLALHIGNFFAPDSDGTMTKALYGKLREKGKRVFKLDPYNLVPYITGAHWNPLDEITVAVARHGEDVAVRFARTIAEGLIREDNSKQPYFTNTARTFLTGLILYVWRYEERKTIVRVRELLAGGLPEKAQADESPFAVLLWEMSQCNDFGGVISSAASTISTAKSSGGGNHSLSTALDQTAFLDYPEVRRICESSDFSVEELKTGNASLFIVAPAGDMKTKLSGWFRLLTVLTLYSFENIPGKLENPTLFALDEMPSMGRIEAVEQAAPVMRKYGVRLLAVAQDIEQLRTTYPEKWGGFLGNAEAEIYMGTNHLETLEYIHKRLGRCTRVEKVKGEEKPRYQQVERDVMDPDQIAKFLDAGKQNMLVIRNGRSPLKLKQARYYKELPVSMYHGDDRPVARFVHEFRIMIAIISTMLAIFSAGLGCYYLAGTAKHWTGALGFGFAGTVLCGLMLWGGIFILRYIMEGREMENHD